MSKLILVRHGETVYNAQGLWTGWHDPVLSPKGRRHARKIAEQIKAYNISRAFISDLKRAYQTWEIIHDYITEENEVIPARSHEHLRERNYGKFAAKNKWQVRDEVGEETFRRIRRSWDYAPEWGESLKQVYDRAVPYFKQNILPLIHSGDVVITVTHGNTNRALIKHLDNIPEDQVANLEMPHEQVVVYHYKSGKLADKEVLEISL